ncbi:hypothetical protein [Absidia glauca]|uniref:Uncharacterized protein n=1 Tax=Absidia glauca TaxID=4829 RepID=A0A168T3J1_ABSGL|nr:hypothetical protein [Absidia glauca]
MGDCSYLGPGGGTSLSQALPNKPQTNSNVTHWLYHYPANSFAIIMFLSNLLHGATVLIAPAVALLLAAISYMVAALKGQSFASSKILGGTGTDNVV